MTSRFDPTREFAREFFKFKEAFGSGVSDQAVATLMASQELDSTLEYYFQDTFGPMQAALVSIHEKLADINHAIHTFPVLKGGDV